MERVIAALALVWCTGCNVEGLRKSDIYGLAPDPEVWLYGLVTNARTGAPLPGVSIQVEGRSSTSDANGAYRIEELDAIDASGTASVHGFQTLSMSLNLHPGANARDIALQPQECGRFMCTDAEFCDPPNGMCVTGATLSGSVINDCDETAVDARVTIDGKSVCSTGFRSGKAYFQLKNLTPGGPHVISIGKPDFIPYAGQLTLQPGLNAMDPVRLRPKDGCPGSGAAYSVCTCTETTCQ